MTRETVNLLGAFESLPVSDREEFAAEVVRRLGSDFASHLPPGGHAIDAVRGKLGSEILQYIPVIAHAVSTFGDETKAAHWLTTPLNLLGNRSPTEVLQERGGIDLVDQILGRIEHNIPS